MAIKAKSLRDIANVFTPQPFTQDQMAFYQPTAIARDGYRYEYHEILFDHIVNSFEHVHCLAIGHGGCGKSTEMHVLSSKLNDEVNIPSIIINATKDLNIANITYIDIFILIVERLVDYADKKDIKIPKSIIKSFNASLSTIITKEHWSHELNAAVESEVSISVLIPLLATLASKIAGAIKTASGFREELRRELKPNMGDITDAVNALIQELNNAGTDIVIMLDGFEKVPLEYTRTLFIQDGSALAAIKTHMIIACPITLYRSTDAAALQSNFPLAELMPMIKTHNPDITSSPYQPGIDVVKELILRRVDDIYFENGVLDKIISMGGGNLQSTFHLLRDSAFHAHMRKSETIDMDCCNIVLNKYATDVFLRVNSRFFPILKKIYEGDFTLENNDDVNELLYAGAVFEYNAERWKDLHPLIRYHISKRPEVLG